MSEEHYIFVAGSSLGFLRAKGIGLLSSLHTVVTSVWFWWIFGIKWTNSSFAGHALCPPS